MTKHPHPGRVFIPGSGLNKPQQNPGSALEAPKARSGFGPTRHAQGSTFVSSGPNTYALSRVIAKAGQSVVVQGQNQSTGEAVALKYYPASKVRGAAREITALKRLGNTHVNIISLKDAIRGTDGGMVLVLPLMRKNTLYDELQKNGAALDEARGRLCASQLSSALYYCHLNGVAHGDIKLENVLRSGPDHYVLCDFGLSTVVDVKEGAGVAVSARNYALKPPTAHSISYSSSNPKGTPHYFSPSVVECLRSRGTLTYDPFAADCWSLGVLLYAVLHGAMPFNGTTDEELFDEILFKKVFPSFSLSEEAIDALYGLLDKAEASRSSMATFFAHAWLS